MASFSKILSIQLQARSPCPKNDATNWQIPQGNDTLIDRTLQSSTFFASFWFLHAHWFLDAQVWGGSSVSGCGRPGDAPDRPNPTLGGVLNLPPDLSHESDGWDDF